MFLSGKIGDEYLSWRNGEVVLITSPTGSGKTYFMLHKLLGRAIERGERILYLVNRKILKKQLEEELNSKVAVEMNQRYGEHFSGVGEYIRIMTYQSIEQAILCYDYNLIEKIRAKYTIVVFDECHYFYNDSDFNTNTELSYDCLRSLFVGKLQIFMSATIKNMQPFIQNRKFIPMGDEINIWKDNMAQMRVYDFLTKGNFIKNYDMENLNSNLKLRVFENVTSILDEIVQNVKTGNQKWLLFVDSIDLGKKLKMDVEELGVKEVVFIDANYDKEESASLAVDELAKKQLISKSVIISTAVMDNGISFHDLELRNIVLLADTEESFIQMLGRKRRDTECLNVYICKRDTEYFKKRLDYVKRVLQFYERHHSRFYNMYLAVKNEKQEICLANPYMFWERHMNNWQISLQQPFITDIMKNTQNYKFARKLFYSVNGIFAVNHFVIGKYQNLLMFYEKIIEELSDDEMAFAKLQAKWLGLEAGQIEEYIQLSEEQIFQEKSELLKAEIENVCDEDLNKEDALAFKKKIKEVALYFLNKEKGQSDLKIISDLKKNDRPITPETFALITRLAQLPYTMKKPNKSIYCISKEEK